MKGERLEKLLNSKYFSACTVVFLLVLPNFIWIVLDKGLWTGDPVGYALNSVSLYHNLLTNLRAWLPNFFTGYKAPLILWLGQCFVPLGYCVGSVNFALLLIPFLSTFATLFLIFRSFELVFENKWIALCGCVMVAGAPMYNGLSRGFWIEPIQVAIVSWFIYAMLHAKKWSFHFALAQFLISGSLAMLTKVSSPLYLIAPSVVFGFTLFSSKPTIVLNKKSMRWLFISLLFVLPTLFFYGYNFKALLAFAHFAASSPLFAMPSSKWQLCMQAMNTSVFLPFSLGLVLLLLLLAFVKTIKQADYKKFTVVFFVALFQILIFFIAWQNSVNADTRYFLPALPYFVLLVCWAIKTVNHKIITVAMVGVFALQFTKVTAFAYGIGSLNVSYGSIQPLTTKPDKASTLFKTIATLAYRDSAIIFDLNPEPGVAEFQFELAKSNLFGNWRNSCIDISQFFNYNHQEIDTAKIDVELVWQKVLAYHPDYYITWTARLSTAAAEIEIQKTDRYNAATVSQRWAIADKMKNCALYKPLSFKSYPELLVYKRRELP